VALVDSGFALLCHQILGMHATGLVPERLGSASPITAPYECFRTRDSWIMIAAGNDRAFLRLCAALELTDVADDPRFESADARVQNRDGLHALLEEPVSLLSTRECIDRLERHGVPASPVHDLRQAVDHPLTTERGLVRPAAAGSGTGLPQVRLPIEEVRSPRAPDPPRLGQHSREVLEEAGFTAEEIASLGVPAGGRPGNSEV
jgi:crotonobetainyl-CoA:carnitine CoA-transferase CaiB-like acyl-CoA transferase